jgi:transposase
MNLPFLLRIISESIYDAGMFIRKSTKKDPKNGKSYSAFYLVESIRTEKGPRQRVLLYMGSELNVPEAEHKLLAQCIEDIISGQQSLIPYPEPIERIAQTYASQLIRRLSEAVPEHSINSENATQLEEFVTIDINTIEQSEPRSVGSEHLLLKMSQQLQLPEKLKELEFSKTEVSIALGAIIARAVHPDSELATYAWLCNKSGLDELLDLNFKNFSHNRLYQISDKLLAHKNVLEDHLEKIEQQFHGYKSTIALYDLTNTYMEGQAKSNPKAKNGLSKEKRSDCPLVTLGLVMNEHGFLNRTSIFPGNASEPKTLQEMIASLSCHECLFKPIILLDAGIATKENLQWLRDKQYKYIVSARQDAPSNELEGELVPVGDLKNYVKAALMKSSDGDEKWLYCESEAKGAVAGQMKQSFKKRFEEDLQKLAIGLTKPKGRKNYIKVLERIGRLREKHKKISGCYEVEVKASEDGIKAAAVNWKIIDEKMNEKLTGSYYLRTNLVEIGPKELWGLYNTLRGVEDAFRFMKSSLGLRPVYHQKEHRVDGHLWITVLAYHLIQNCRYQLSQQGINHHWKTIREIMNSRIRVTTQAKTEEGTVLYHRSTTKAEGEQVDIYKALRLSPQILKAQKTII